MNVFKNYEMVPNRNTDKTKFIDISKLERESYKFLLIGFIGALVFIGVLEPFVTFRDYADLIKEETGRPIRVELITIPPPYEKKEVEKLIIEESKKFEPTVIETPDTLDKQISEKPSEITFNQFIPDKFPALGAHPEIPLQDTLRPPGDMLLFPPEPKAEKIITLPPEAIKDERRRFKTDFFGIGVGGIGALPLHLGRHAAKRIVWKVQDKINKSKMEDLRNKNFRVVTEKELKFMILLWRDGLLDPFKLSQRDRLFLAESESDEIITHKKYLDKMEKRGFVSSLLVSGRILSRANFSRLEILHTFMKTFININESDEKNTTLKYIELINRYYDNSKKRVVIPE